MAIDKVTVNLYTCCKCQYKWLGGWDTENNKEHPVPFYCPKCKNFRWDKDYTDQEKELFDAVLNKHVLDNKQEKTICVDIIALDFLYRIRPQPDMFELRQAVSIAKAEKRHEFMLSIMEDRAKNYDKYYLERFSKYSPGVKAAYTWIYKRGTEHVLMKGCKHEDRHKAVRQQLKERGLALMTDSRRPNPA